MLWHSGLSNHEYHQTINFMYLSNIQMCYDTVQWVAVAEYFCESPRIWLMEVSVRKSLSLQRRTNHTCKQMIVFGQTMKYLEMYKSSTCDYYHVHDSLIHYQDYEIMLIARWWVYIKCMYSTYLALSVVLKQPLLHTLCLTAIPV